MCMCSSACRSWTIFCVRVCVSSGTSFRVTALYEVFEGCWLLLFPIWSYAGKVADMSFRSHTHARLPRPHPGATGTCHWMFSFSRSSGYGQKPAVKKACWSNSLVSQLTWFFCAVCSSFDSSRNTRHNQLHTWEINPCTVHKHALASLLVWLIQEACTWDLMSPGMYTRELRCAPEVGDCETTEDVAAPAAHGEVKDRGENESDSAWVSCVSFSAWSGGLRASTFFFFDVDSVSRCRSYLWCVGSCVRKIARPQLRCGPQALNCELWAVVRPSTRASRVFIRGGTQGHPVPPAMRTPLCVLTFVFGPEAAQHLVVTLSKKSMTSRPLHMWRARELFAFNCHPPDAPQGFRLRGVRCAETCPSSGSPPATLAFGSAAVVRISRLNTWRSSSGVVFCGDRWFSNGRLGLRMLLHRMRRSVRCWYHSAPIPSLGRVQLSSSWFGHNEPSECEFHVSFSHWRGICVFWGRRCPRFATGDCVYRGRISCVWPCDTEVTCEAVSLRGAESGPLQL